MSFMEKYKEQIYSILRFVTGFLFLWHGAQKILHYPPLPPGIIPPVHVVLIGGSVELIGGILVCIGLFTRWAAFFACGEMAYAFWTVHAKMGALPMTNGGEPAILYCFVFLFIWAYGAGIWSVDSLIHKKNIIHPNT